MQGFRPKHTTDPIAAPQRTACDERRILLGFTFIKVTQVKTYTVFAALQMGIGTQDNDCAPMRLSVW